MRCGSEDLREAEVARKMLRVLILFTCFLLLISCTHRQQAAAARLSPQALQWRVRHDASLAADPLLQAYLTYNLTGRLPELPTEIAKTPEGLLLRCFDLAARGFPQGAARLCESASSLALGDTADAAVLTQLFHIWAALLEKRAADAVALASQLPPEAKKGLLWIPVRAIGFDSVRQGKAVIEEWLGYPMDEFSQFAWELALTVALIGGSVSLDASPVNDAEVRGFLKYSDEDFGNFHCSRRDYKAILAAIEAFRSGTFDKEGFGAFFSQCMYNESDDDAFFPFAMGTMYCDIVNGVLPPDTFNVLQKMILLALNRYEGLHLDEVVDYSQIEVLSSSCLIYVAALRAPGYREVQAEALGRRPFLYFEESAGRMVTLEALISMNIAHLWMELQSEQGE